MSHACHAVQIRSNIAVCCSLLPFRLTKVSAQFLWETSARVLVDFTPGAGTMIKSALMMSVKCIAVCLNEHHQRILKDILRSYIVNEMQGVSSKHAPADKQERLNSVKPARLLAWEAQRKRGGDAIETPAAKRSALAASCDEMLSMLESGPAPKPKAKPKAAPPAGAGSAGAAGGAGGAPAAGGAGAAGGASAAVAAIPAGEAPAAPSAPAAPKAAPKAAPVTAPVENLQNLQAMLQQWG